MNDDLLISVEGVSKKFCRDLKRSLWYGVQDTAADLLGRDGASIGLRQEEFWAVDNVSFELRRGECLGLIGRNGAGKTTLLKMLNGLIKPDRGRIEVRGRVGALIALGAGFNPILTGRENIYVNGAVLGLSKREIDSKYDEIVDFAEISEFINAPVQSYSSGMQVRLGFAVATALRPDVLLLDEVLAVGDIAFRMKCFNRIERLRSSAATILVSHNTTDIARICTKTLVRAGTEFVEMSTSKGIQYYEQSQTWSGVGFVACEPGFSLLQATVSPPAIHWREHVRARLAFDSPAALSEVEARVTFMGDDDVVLAEWRSSHNCGPLQIDQGVNTLEFDIGPVLLKPGSYAVGFVLSKPAMAQYLILSFRSQRITVHGNVVGISNYQLEGKVASV